MKNKNTIEHYTSLESLREAWGLKPVPSRKKKKIKVDRILAVSNY